MKKTKLEKGITLIALIITIVVLLILAVVSIGAIKNSKIISHSQNAADEYIVAQEKEQLQLAVTEWQLQKNIQGNTKTFKATIEEALIGKGAEVGQADPDKGPLTVTFTKTRHVYELAEDGTITAVDSSTEGGTDNPSGSEGDTGSETVMPVATIDVVVSENSTINGKAYSSSNPVIPAGFKAINVTTEGHESSWTAEDGPEVSKGLVISDGTSEFVWIPVENDSFSAHILETEPTVITGRDEESYDVVIENLEIAGVKDKDENGFVDKNDFLIQLTEEYDEMVKSVKKYNGFYVGRYELSLGSDGNAKCIANVLPITAESDTQKDWSGTWYGLYALSKKYQTNSVKSSMIWGCQYNAVMTFIGDEAMSKENADHENLNDMYKTGGTDYNGTVSYSDVFKNIYDLEGNLREWTLAGLGSIIRSLRGGSWKYSGMPMTIAGDQGYPDKNYKDAGSRLILYIK